MTDLFDAIADREDDLAAVWDEIRPPSPITVVSARGSDFQSLATVASEQTIFDLAQVIKKKYDQKAVTSEMLADVVTTGVRMFLERWRTLLTDQNLTGLIEIVLEGQHLTASEMQGFVQALPLTLLTKIANSAVGTVSGTHALLSMEIHRRAGSGPEYTMGSEGRKIWVEFVHPGRNEAVRFFTDEAFEV